MWYEVPVTTLLDSAARGIDSAWREIVRRYSPLVYSVCRRHGIRHTDAEDVAGNVWLHLVSGVRSIRQPEALPGWLATTTRRECLNHLDNQRRNIPSDREIADELSPDADVSVLAEERRYVVRAAVAELSDRDRDLLWMLFSDPPTPYVVISSTLGMPIGAIGPTRQRCLARVRRVLTGTSLGNESHWHSTLTGALAS
jgi:RNA polymerase sigma factor (sigma-70 family)